MINEKPDTSIQKDLDELTKVNDSIKVDTMSSPDPNAIVPETSFTGEDVKVAGVAGGIKTLLKESLKGRIVTPEVKASKSLKKTKPEKIETTKPSEELPAEPEIKQIEPVTDNELDEVIKTKDKILSKGVPKILSKGVPKTAPSPTPKQAAEGVLQGQLNTVKTSDDALRALDLAQLKVLRKGKKNIKKTTITELREEIADSGLMSKELDKLLKGEPLTAKIGDYDLTKKIVLLKEAHDINAKLIQNTIQKFETSGLDDVEKYNLLVKMTENSEIANVLSGAGTEIATSMNAFKRIENLGPNVDLNDIKQVLGENMNDTALNRFVNLYNKSPDMKAKNKLVNKTGGSLDNWLDSAYYTFQSNLLSSPTTWMDNFVGTIMHGSLMGVESVISVPIGKARRAIKKRLGKPDDLPQDIAEFDDLLNGLHGFKEGLFDGLKGAAHVLKTGQRAGFKGEKYKALSSDMLPNELKVNNPLTQTARTFNTSKLKNTWVGKMIDGIGFVQSIPMRMLAAGDEIVGNTAARMALHKESSIFAKNRIAELEQLGKTEQEIRNIVGKEVSEFMTEQPAEIFASTKEIKDMLQFTYKWDKTKRLDRGFAAVNQALNNRYIRFFTPFANTLTKIVDQTASRIPGVNFISPQFYKDISRGGKYADRASARLVTGTVGIGVGYFAADNNMMTGAGPVNFQQRKALMNLGWQPYALKINKDNDSMSVENLDKLSKLVNVTQTDEHYYISYQRFDMVAQVLAMGADINDSHRFSREDPTSSAGQEISTAYALSSAEFMKNLPVMQFIGEMADITGGHYQDNGDRLLDLFERMVIQSGKAAVLSVPLVGITQGTLAQQIAKTIDKEKKETMPEERLGYGKSDQGSAALDRMWNGVIERTPVWRGELDQQLDEAGRPIFNKNTVIQHWLNAVPSVRMSETIHSPMDEVLAEYYTGLSVPSKSWEGVKLSGRDYNDFKRLYGQQLKMTIPVDIDGNEESMNMEIAIVKVVAREKSLAEEAGEYYAPGDARDDISKTVSMYRAEAKKRMLGDTETPADREENRGIARYTGEWMDEEGNMQPALNPKLASDINFYNGFKRLSLNP